MVPGSLPDDSFQYAPWVTVFAVREPYCVHPDGPDEIVDSADRNRISRSPASLFVAIDAVCVVPNAPSDSTVSTSTMAGDATA